MAGLSLGGLNLDVSGIVSQLMSIEARPFDKLVEQQTAYKSQLSELGRLKSTLSTFQSSMESLSSLDKFETYKASNSESSDKLSFSTSVDKDAIAGIYSINVTSLASVNKLGQTSGVNDNFDATTPLNTNGATLDLTVGSDPTLSIDIDGKTISEARDAINDAANTAKIGLSASIIQTGSDKFQLVITAKDTGIDNRVQFASNDASSALFLSEIQTATDGKVEIDGYEVSSSTNKIEGAIDGVTINLLQANPSATNADLTISRDTAAAESAVKDFIKSYNTLISSIDIYETGALEGDSFLANIKNTFRQQINTSSDTGAFNYLAEIGVTSNAKTGDLELNSSVLRDAISNDYEAVSKLFAEKDKGVAFRLDKMIDNFISYDGLLKSKENSINSRLKLNSKDQDRLSVRLELKEASYLKQYSALDTLISKMNSTSSSLTAQLSSLPGFG
ncbi:MAG: flagellar filament capping protein FliD [Pseudomonadota bacterium]